MGWVCRAVPGAPSFLSLGLPAGDVTEDSQRVPGSAGRAAWVGIHHLSVLAGVGGGLLFFPNFLVLQVPHLSNEGDGKGNVRSEGACEVLRWVPGTEQVNSQC